MAERGRIPADLFVPDKPIDISALINEIYGRIKDYFIKNHTLTFFGFIPSQSKEDKLYTFLPLLYLANQNKISLEQTVPFGDIDITLAEQ